MMSVYVLGQTGADSWSAGSADAVEAAGSAAHVATGATTMPADIRVVLASTAVPPALIAAVFGAPAARACRKIIVLEGAATAALPLFDIADILVFPAAGLADMLRLERWPDDGSAPVAVQGMLRRHNQAAVVRFSRNAATAIWAERTLDVAGPCGGDDDGTDDDGTMARFGGTIAAAVDQGVGPEQALVMALAAAAAVAR